MDLLTPPRTRAAGTLLVAVAVLLAAVRVALVASLPHDRAVGLFDDDAYYYFGIARHLAAGDGSTFDGIDATNGYHPLWLLVLVPVFAVAEGRAALVVVTLLSAAVLVAVAVLLARIGAGTGRPWATAAAAAPLLATGVAGPAFFFSGMETGLLLLGLVALAAVLVAGGADRRPPPGVAAALGGLVALTALARLDAVFPLAVLCAGLVLRWREPRRTFLLGAPPALAMGVYALAQTALFGTPLPVSGQAKALGEGPFQFGVLGQFLGSPVVLGAATWLGLVALLAVPGAVLLDRRAPGPARAATLTGAAVLAGGLLAVLYYGATSTWQLWPWYFSGAPAALALAGPALLVRVPLLVRGERWAARLALAAAVLVLAVTGARTAAGSVSRSAFVEAGPALGAELDAVVPPGTAVAMGDRAGSVGFHTARPVVQLEGLVGSVEYLDVLRSGSADRFLAERRVGFYVRGDADEGRSGPGTAPGCREFTEPAQGSGPKVPVVVCDDDLVLTLPLSDGTRYRVWRWSPDPTG